jgi:hypothetical protein
MEWRILTGLAVDPDQTQNGPGAGHDCDAGFLSSTVQTFFRRCAGLVDAASVAVIDSCQGERNDGVLDPQAPSDQTNRSRRKQGGVLEFPADGELQDDVSALSANTLEEMERLAKMMAENGLRRSELYDGSSRPYPGQVLTHPPALKTDARAKLHAQEIPSDADLSIGIATSGSSSSQEDQAVPDMNRACQRSREVENFLPNVEHRQTSYPL